MGTVYKHGTKNQSFDKMSITLEGFRLLIERKENRLLVVTITKRNSSQFFTYFFENMTDFKNCIK